MRIFGIYSVRWKASKCRLLSAAVVLILRFFPCLGFSSGDSSSLLDCRDILGKFALVGGRFVDENHEFYSMGGVNEVAAESVTMGNHNF